MPSVSTLIEHLGEFNPRMHLAETPPAEAIHQIDAGIHPSSQVIPGSGETEIARYLFTGGILSAVSQNSGMPMRLLPEAEAPDVQLIPFVSGEGVVVVTDRRLLGQMNGESPLSDKIDEHADGHLYFSMGYEDVNSISISQEPSPIGAVKQRRVNVQGLEVLGALGVEVFAAVTLGDDDVTQSTLRSGRPFFDQVVLAAATYRMGLDPNAADQEQLQRVVSGLYSTEDGELVADLIAERE